MVTPVSDNCSINSDGYGRTSETMKELMYIPFSFEDGGTRVIHYTPESYEPLV